MNTYSHYDFILNKIRESKLKHVFSVTISSENPSSNGVVKNFQP